VKHMVSGGMWIQLTAGSVLGRFGKRARYWSERMLQEGVVHIIASDAHDTERRPPLLAEARETVSRLVGAEEATHMVVTRPAGVVRNLPPSGLPAPRAAHTVEPQRRARFTQQLSRP
jgi:protein-tyrosine phosphatase